MRKLNITYLRRSIQVIFLLFMLYGGFLGIRSCSAPEESQADKEAKEINANLAKDPRLDIYMPIRSCKNTGKDAGVFKGCAMFMFTEVLIFRNFMAYAVPLAFVAFLCFFFGRFLCGWFCPIGFFQEILDWIRGIFRINYIKLSRRTSSMLKKFRYAWLSILFIVSFGIALPLFDVIRKDLHNLNCLTCPTRYVLWFFPKFAPTFMSFNTTFYSIASVILIIFIGIFIMSFFVRRFWCRICPNGAFLSLWNKGCLTSKVKDVKKCTKCGICYEICPMDNEDVYEKRDRKVVNSKNCVMCMECLNRCPENDCLKLKMAGVTVLKSKFK